MKDLANCIFCKIVEKAVPAHIVYEDVDFLAFLDIHPQSPGHVQIIPKEHVRWVWDVENIGGYFEVVQKVALALRKAYGTEWIISKVVGDEVPHAHVWLFLSDKDGPSRGDKMDFATNKNKIIEAMK